MLQQFLTSQFLHSQHQFCFDGNYTEAQIHPIFTIRLHFTQKILSRGFLLENIKVTPKPLDKIFSNFLKKMFFDVQTILMQ